MHANASARFSTHVPRTACMHMHRMRGDHSRSLNSSVQVYWVIPCRKPTSDRAWKQKRGDINQPTCWTSANRLNRAHQRTGGQGARSTVHGASTWAGANTAVCLEHSLLFWRVSAPSPRPNHHVKCKRLQRSRLRIEASSSKASEWRLLRRSLSARPRSCGCSRPEATPLRVLHRAQPQLSRSRAPSRPPLWAG